MTKHKYTIDKGVTQVSLIPVGVRSVYHDMQVGDSVAYEHGHTARAAAKAANAKHAPKKFEAGLDGADTPRVWRTA